MNLKKAIAGIMVCCMVGAVIPFNSKMLSDFVTSYAEDSEKIVNKKIRLFFQTSLYDDYISIPNDIPQEYQIPVDDYENCSDIIYDIESITVSNGMIKPCLKTTQTSFWASGVTLEVTTGEAGTTELFFKKDDTLFCYEIEIIDYGKYYCEQYINKWIDENIDDSMTDEEKLNKIASFPASYDYKGNAIIGGTAMILEGGGDCHASTLTVNYMCSQLGFYAWSRDAFGDAGAGSGHTNSFVMTPDGSAYIVEAGYQGTAPRSYDVKKTKNEFIEDENFIYYLQNDGTAQIKKYIGTSEELTIPSEINGHIIDSLGSNLFKNCKNLKKVYMPDTITNMGSNLFAECSNLEEVQLSESLWHIGTYCFQKCIKLKNVKIPDSVKEIWSNAFEKCTSLESIVIPNSVIKICSYAFNDCISLKEVVLSESLTKLDSYTFIDCKSLVSIDIPESIEELNGAFINCTSLENIKLPENLKKLGGQEFQGCLNLKNLVLPEGVESLGFQCFWGCYQLNLTVLNPDCAFNDKYRLQSIKSISGYSGSTAEEFAKEYNKTFIALKTGDANADGSVDVSDAVMLQRWLLGAGELTCWKNVDLCKDDRIDIFDMVMMRKLIVEKDS